jgi:hypothetical protein
VGPVVVVVDVGADHLPGLVEGLELMAPDAAFLEVTEPALDERLALGVAVATAAVSDAEARQHEPSGTCGERGAVMLMVIVLSGATEVSPTHYSEEALIMTLLIAGAAAGIASRARGQRT